MKTTLSPQIERQPSAFYRWTVLFFISMAMFGNYYVYDSISPLADLLKLQLGFSDKSIGSLNAIYSLPNILMVVIGGVLIDRIGAKSASLIFSGLCMAGALITVLKGELWLMATGRLVFGLGAESLIVAITTVIAKWFKGKELSFAFGLNLTIARLGTFTALNSPFWARGLYDSWKGPLLIAVVAGLVSFLSIVIYFILESDAKKRYHLGEAEEVEKVSLQVFKDLNASFWYITLLCVTFYSAIFPFQTFAVKFFIEHHGVSRAMAGFTSSFITFASMIGTPLFGVLIDLKGKRASLMMLGSFLLIPVYLMLIYVPVHPLVPMIMMGVAFSLIPAAMWPSVALIVKEQNLGTAYGVMTMVQNIGLALFNYVIGWANDSSGGYTLGMWVFSILGFLGIAFSYLLKRHDARMSDGLLENLTVKDTA
jgi:predicted MFS family arabinose efflux permease